MRIDPKVFCFHKKDILRKSWKKYERKKSDEFNGDLFFWHGKTNCYGVLVGFYGNISYYAKKKLIGNSGRILVLDVTIDGKPVQREYWTKTVKDFRESTEDIKRLSGFKWIISLRFIISAGDFKLFFDQKLESAGGNSILKKLVVCKLIDPFNFCDIWRIRNPKSEAFTFQQRHSQEFCKNFKQYARVG